MALTLYCGAISSSLKEEVGPDAAASSLLIIMGDGHPGPFSLSLHLEHLLICFSSFRSGQNSYETELKLVVNVTEWYIS